jgi:hypothetical protein
MEIVGHHFEIRAEGRFSVDGLLSMIGYVAEHEEWNRVIFDLRRLTGDLNTFARYTLGLAISEKLKDRRVACLGETGKINKIGENTAVNRGAMLLVTDTYQDALDWIMG